MTSISLSKKRQQLQFKKQQRKEIVADFIGGMITSNAGLLLIAELDKKLKITEKFSKCFRDYRHSSYIDYSVNQLLAQRIYGLILGYEDLNDHEHLRNDPFLMLALEKLNFLDDKEKGLAGKSTLNRLEYCPEDVLKQSEHRYHKIETLPQKIEKAFVDIFLDSYSTPPQNIIIDMDVTDDEVHGNQEGVFFNKYYNSVCYAPLYIFCGHHLLAAKLRSSNVDPAEGALEELERIIALIREKWSDTHILVRADSAYAREEIMSFCESQAKIDYVLAMATNNQLKLRASEVIEKAKIDYENRVEIGEAFLDTPGFQKEELETIREVVPNALWYRSLCYKTERSWSRSRRVVTKVEYGNEGLKMRHVVTSLPASRISPSLLYTKKYCPRGEMENRLKEQQLDLFADRTSTHHFESNQLRLWLSSMAYVLVQAFRQHCLKKTPLQKATVGTIRLKLLKLGARVVVSIRRILISIASSCSYQDIFKTAYLRIMAISETG